MTLDTARSRWIALYVLCLGDLMIVVDLSIVNVALPSIQNDLGFSDASLAWVINAYLLTFGGFLLLGGVSATCSASAGFSSAGLPSSRRRRSCAASRRASGCSSLRARSRGLAAQSSPRLPSR